MLSAVVPLCIRPFESIIHAKGLQPKGQVDMARLLLLELHCCLEKYAGSFDSELPESYDGIIMCVTRQVCLI